MNSEEQVKRWCVQTRFVVVCAYCFHDTTVSTDCNTPQDAIQELLQYGWRLRVEGPMCEKCAEERRAK